MVYLPTFTIKKSTIHVSISKYHIWMLWALYQPSISKKFIQGTFLWRFASLTLLTIICIAWCGNGIIPDVTWLDWDPKVQIFLGMLTFSSVQSTVYTSIQLLYIRVQLFKIDKSTWSKGTMYMKLEYTIATSPCSWRTHHEHGGWSQCQVGTRNVKETLWSIDFNHSFTHSIQKIHTKY